MPAKLITRKREYQPSGEQEQAAPVARRPRPEADEAEPMETGRPHQAFVESEARKYWQDMVYIGSLAKPDRQELRAAAMPVLIKCLQKRGVVRFLAPTVKAHMAVNVMHMHAADRGELTGRPYPSPDHIEALLRYMKVTRLAPQPIPLPWHEAPKHPPIYYYIDPITKQPTPREDALIRAEYVRDKSTGELLTEASHIYPSTDPHGQPPPEVVENKSGVYYRLKNTDVKVIVEICIVLWIFERPIFFAEFDLSRYKFTPHRPESYEDDPLENWPPDQALIESEARKYWQDMVNTGSLAKPDRQELRAAAMPILLKCLRKRGWVRFLAPTVKAHMAVNVMYMHATDRGELTGEYKGPYLSSDHIDALLRYMKVTRLAPQPIPLPWHGAPKHPTIYYYIDPITKQPTPREDALIRAEYVRRRWDGKPVTRMSHIHPSDPYGQPPPEVVERKSGIYYRLSVERGEIKVSICYLFWPKPEKHREPGTMVMPLSDYKFTPHYFKPAWLESDEDEP